MAWSKVSTSDESTCSSSPRSGWRKSNMGAVGGSGVGEGVGVAVGPVVTVGAPLIDCVGGTVSAAAGVAVGVCVLGPGSEHASMLASTRVVSSRFSVRLFIMASRELSSLSHLEQEDQQNGRSYGL